jgi:hypothetical protein
MNSFRQRFKYIDIQNSDLHSQNYNDPSRFKHDSGNLELAGFLCFYINLL